MVPEAANAPVAVVVAPNVIVPGAPPVFKLVATNVAEVNVGGTNVYPVALAVAVASAEDAIVNVTAPAVPAFVASCALIVIENAVLAAIAQVVLSSAKVTVNTGLVSPPVAAVAVHALEPEAIVIAIPV